MDPLQALAKFMTIEHSLDPAVMRRTIDAYLASWESADVEARLACFTADATLQDPAGAPTLRGHGEIRAFFEAVGALPQKSTPRFEWMVASGTECIFQFVMRNAMDGGPVVEMTITEILSFANDGKISRFKAFWNEGTTRVLA